MLHIVTDGAADMPPDWADHYQIHILPLRIGWGEETFLQGVDIDNEKFYKLVKLRREFPITSLPSPQQVVKFYRSIAKKGDGILSIHLASKLSGTFSVTEMAAKELAGELRVIPIDSGAGSAALGFMCREARLMETAGCTISEIVQRIAEIRKKLTLIFTVDNLEFAYLSGRVNAIQSALGSALQIKPVIILKDGLLYMAEKVRTRQRSIARVIEIVKDRLGNQKINLAVVHAAAPEAAEIIHEKVMQIFDIKEIIVTELALPVAAHLGPGTVGIVAYPASEEYS